MQRSRAATETERRQALRIAREHLSNYSIGFIKLDVAAARIVPTDGDSMESAAATSSESLMFYMTRKRPYLVGVETNSRSFGLVYFAVEFSEAGSASPRSLAGCEEKT
jgi:hypothetical protein